MEKTNAGNQLHAVTIGEHEYQMGAWATEKGIEVLTWLANKAGGAIASFVAVGAAFGDSKGDDKKNDMEEAIESMFAPALQTVFANLKGSEMNAMMARIVSDDILCDGKKIIYNVHYSRKTGHMFKVAMAVLEYQYEDFLGELLSLTGGLRR